MERAREPMTPAVAETEHTDPTRWLRSKVSAPYEQAARAARSLDSRLAARTAAELHLGGGILLCIAALADRRASVPAVGLLAVAALVMGTGMAALERTGEASMGFVYAAELAALGLVAALVAASGGTESAYPAFYLLPVAHTAVFQSRNRLLLAAAAAVVLLFAPLAYGGPSERFVAFALVALVPAAAAASVIHGAVALLRQERRQAAWREAEALRIADSDPLTGVGNYRLFRRALEKESARSRRHGEPFSLIVVDLDGFKAINDEVGHQAGDEALQRVAQALRETLRTEDVLCRQGGDEFGVLAVHVGYAEASELAGRLRAAVGAIYLPQLRRPLSVSVGWATFADPVSTADGLVARADWELRAAKRRRVGSPPPVAFGTPLAAPPASAQVDARLATLSGFARSLALAQDEEEVARLAVGQLVGALDASVAEIWRCDPQSGRPALAARRDQDDEVAGGEAQQGHAGAVAQVLRTNRVLVAPVPRQHALGPESSSQAMELVVPITHTGRVIGAARLVLDRPDSGSPVERRMALALAAQVGVALAAARARAALTSAGPQQLVDCASVTGDSDAAERVADLATGAGAMLGMGREDLDVLRTAALLHRVGMVGVPAGLPLRPFALSDAEREVLQQHPVIAEELLVDVPALRAAGSILRHAYERQDGRGYPDGLAGDAIPLASRALHVAVAYVAMTSHRPYRQALADDQARQELRAAAESGQLDPVVVEVTLAVLSARNRAQVSFHP